MRSIIRLFLLSSFLLTTVPVASAQYFGRNKVQYDQFDFRIIDSDRFDVYFYEEEEEAVRDAARMAERWYRRHSRTYLREFRETKPLIFYANDADFQQTNAIRGRIGQGTGGVTESLKERVIMPLTGLYSETDHVLGHELVHSFQYDIALNSTDTTGFALQLLPLWLIEGTAEYLSVGRDDPHTAMWLRDAALRDDLPTIEQLTSSFKYFPYRFGQAYMAYVGGKYGDAAVANIYKLGGKVGMDSAFVYTVGLHPDSLSNEWISAVKDTYLPLTENRSEPDSIARMILGKEKDGSSMHISPTISPDGKWVAFLSERDLFNINLFIADAETGKIVKKLKSTNRDPHFDSIRFINSAGSWSPDGTKFAFVTFVQGDNELAIMNWRKGSIERRVSIAGVTALSNPSWSPDGNQIAFSGMDGGLSDLYILDLPTNEVRQLTNDRFGDLQPAWSPDGKKIAFVTDRGENGTDFENLSFGKVRLGVIDVESEAIEIIQPFDNSRHFNPQYSPDGRSLFFISDYDGFKDIYRYDLAEEASYRVTDLKTGVSGITGLSPAMTVAGQSGRMVFSTFSNNEYDVYSLEAEETEGTLVNLETSPSLAGVLPPRNGLTSGLVSNYLDDPLTGLPDPQDYPSRSYKPGLKLDFVAPPSVGVTAGGPFGTGVAGGVAFFFSDMLGNHNLAVVAQANGTFKDIGGEVSYLNQKRRFNYGASAGHIPYLIGGALQFDNNNDGFVDQIDLVRQRIFIDRASLNGSYPLSTTKRFDVSSGFVRYGFDYEIERFFPNGEREKLQLDSPDPIYFFQGDVSYVGDYANFAFTSPVQGGRYRFSVSPFVGSESFVRVLADYRRYKFARPVTFAVRGLHVGNYFADDGNPDNTLFSQEYLGYSNSLTFLRGYSFSSFEVNECSSGGGCVYDNLLGSRLALASAEVRLPLLGSTNFGLINFPYLPTEISLFTDAGLAWSKGETPKLAWDRTPERATPLVSSGVATRFNILGYMVFEIYYAYPWQREIKGGHFGLQLIPGW